MKLRLLTVTALILFTTTVWARYSVQPNRFEGSMPAGATYQNEYTISNSLDIPLTLHVRWKDQTINPLSNDWLQLSTSTIVLKGKEEKKLPFTVTIPENATGEYNARVIFTPDPITARKGAMPLMIKYNLAIYMVVKGTENYNFTVEKIEFSNAKTELTNEPAFQCSTTLFNSGNVHIRPTGTIRLISQDTAEEYTLKFNSNEWAFLPEENYTYTDKLDSGTLPDGTYDVNMEITAGTDDKIKSYSKTFQIKISGNDVSVIENK